MSDATLSRAIAKLRRAFGAETRSPRFIETPSKRGCRLLPIPVDVLEVATRPGEVFRFGDWLVEPSLNRMTRSTITALLCLAERAGKSVPERELVDRVWPTEPLSELTVEHRIAELRAALGDIGGKPGYIESVPDGGYRLAAAVGLPEPAARIAPFPEPRHAAGRDPHPGLAVFTVDDPGVFFGREVDAGATVSPALAYVGYAVSPDGIHWGTWHGNPVIAPLPSCNRFDSLAVIQVDNTFHGWGTNCFDVHHLSSPFEVLLFDHFESGGTGSWGLVIPESIDSEPGGRPWNRSHTRGSRSEVGSSPS